MFRVRFTNYAHHALSGDDLTIFATLFYRCLYFHILSPKNCRLEAPTYTLFIPVRYPPLAEVIRRKLDGHPVALQDFDVVLPHPTADPGEDNMAVFQLDSKRCVRQRFFNYPIDRDRPLFGHLLLLIP